MSVVTEKKPAATAPARVPVIGWRLMAAASLLWLLATLPFVTDAGPGFLEPLALGMAGLVIGLAWVIRTAACPPKVWSAEAAWWLSVPASGAIAFGLLATDHGLALRTRLCESRLTGFVAEVAGQDQADWTPRWVGLFYVDEVQEYEGGVYLFTSGGFLNRNGIAHIPPARPRPRKCGCATCSANGITSSGSSSPPPAPPSPAR
jgi:hypothetical protein